MKYTLIFLLFLACCSRINAQAITDAHDQFVIDTTLPSVFTMPIYLPPLTLKERVHILELQNQALTRLLSETRGKLDSLIGEMRNWGNRSLKSEGGTIKVCDSCYHLITQ